MTDQNLEPARGTAQQNHHMQQDEQQPHKNPIIDN